MKTKICTSCKEKKSINQFHTSKAGRFGVDSRCKLCKALYDKERRSTAEYRKKHAEEVRLWRQNNPEEYKAYIEANREKIRITNRESGRRWRKAEPERHLLYKARYRAKKLGLPFELSLEDIVIPNRCPVLGIKLSQEHETGCDNFATLDRVIPSLGYVKGNTNVISYRANRIKNDASLEELQKVTNYVEKATKLVGA